MSLRGTHRAPGQLVITVDGSPFAVVGVMPRGMNYPGGTDLWMPIPAHALVSGAGLGGVSMLLRPRPGSSVQEARAELAAAAALMTADYGLTGHPLRYRLDAVMDSFSRLNPVHVALGGAVGLVLLIACANLGTLVLVRSVARRRELALRAALGASRGVLLRLVLSESLLIALGGAAVGIVLALWGIALAYTAIPPSVEQLGVLAPRLSWRVFAFGLAAAATTVLLATLAPALRAARADPGEALKEGAGTATGRTHRRYDALVIAEVALALVLLMGAGLLLKSSARLHTFAFGYDPRGLTAAVTRIPEQVSRAPGGIARFHDDLVERARALPQVQDAALLGGRGVGRYRGRYEVTVEDPGRGLRERFLLGYHVVSPGLLRTLGIRVLAGRDFEKGDAQLGGVAIVDSSLALRLFPNTSPIGRMVKLGPAHSDAPWVRVVGVARSAFFHVAPDEFPPEALYVVRRADDSTRRFTLVVRARREGAGVAMALRREIDALAPRAAGAAYVYRWSYSLDGAVEQTDFLTALLLTFAGFGVLVAVVGLHGVLAYTVRQRLREFAVRAALGAEGRHLARLVLHDCAVMVLAGTGVGAFAALWVARWLRFSLFGFDHFDPWALVGAELVLFALSAAAALAPLRLASRADPLAILRAT